MNTDENIFEGLIPVPPKHTIDTLPDLTLIKALVTPPPKEGKGRKTYDIPCIIKSDGVTSNVVLEIKEPQRVAFEVNQYQQVKDGALIALTRKA